MVRYLRRIYNLNSAGNYPGLSFPQELADRLTNYVFLEEVPEGILIRRAKIEPLV